MKRKQKNRSKLSVINIFSILITFVLAGTYALITMSTEQINDLNSDRLSLMEDAQNFKNASNYLTTEVRNYVATRNEIHFDNYWNEVETTKTRELSVAAMQDIGITATEQDIIDQMATLSNELVPLESQAMELAKQGDLLRATELVFGDEYEAVYIQIDVLHNEFENMLSTRTTQAVDNAMQNIHIVQVVAFTLLLILVILLIRISVIIRNGLIRPIAQCSQVLDEMLQGNLSPDFSNIKANSEIDMLSEAIKNLAHKLSAIIGDIDYGLEAMAQGDFTVDSQVKELYVGDFNRLAKSMYIILEGLSYTLQQINTSATQVSLGSDHMSETSRNLANGSVEQAAAVEELSSTLSETSDMIAQTSENAKKAAQANKTAMNELQNSNSQMQDMMLSMNDISEKSKEINKIIKTIDDIAFQTNILSLNAAVEAARAGTAGKGFGVVADEVRNLATKSAEAAKSTALLIEQTVQAVRGGEESAQSTAESLSNLLTSSGEVDRLVNEISADTEQQSFSISQLKDGVEQISAVVLTNSAASEQSAAASTELSEQAVFLKGMVDKFKIRENTIAGNLIDTEEANVPTPEYV